MKKLYLFLLLSLVGAVQLRAQAIDSLKYKLDYLLAPLDKSQVPTGLLAGYGASLAPMTSFNGVLADSRGSARVRTEIPDRPLIASEFSPEEMLLSQ